MLLGAVERLVLFVRPLHAALDGVACLFWSTASPTLVGGPASTFLDPLGSTGGGGASTTTRGSAPCARRAGLPLELKST